MIQKYSIKNATFIFNGTIEVGKKQKLYKYDPKTNPEGSDRFFDDLNAEIDKMDAHCTKIGGLLITPGIITVAILTLFFKEKVETVNFYHIIFNLSVILAIIGCAYIGFNMVKAVRLKDLLNDVYTEFLYPINYIADCIGNTDIIKEFEIIHDSDKKPLIRTEYTDDTDEMSGCVEFTQDFTILGNYNKHSNIEINITDKTIKCI